MTLVPSAKYPMGTDNAGRDMLALMVHGIHPSLKIGLISGILGTILGTLLGLVAGYSRGWVDMVISTAADIMLTIPSLMVLIVLASYLCRALFWHRLASSSWGLDRC